MVKRVLAIILATIISFTAVETTGLFFVSANNVINSYENSNQEKDEEYYFKAYTADGQKATSEMATKLTPIVQVMTGTNQKTYQAVFVMANGVTVTATDVKDESGNWKATKIACTGEDSDGSYLETNYDIVHLFGGSHNSDEKVESTDVTLDGTTHVQSVWGGGWHKSQTVKTKVTVKGNAEVKAIQGGAAAFFAGSNCGTSGCSGYNGNNSSKPCFDKPEQDTPEAYNANGNARVDSATVVVESFKPYTTPSGVKCDTLIFGGGECYAYTGTVNVTVSGGEFTDNSIVYPAGSNGYTGESTLVVDGNVTIPKVASAKSGIVKSANIEIKNGTVKELTLGMIQSDEGYGQIEASKVTVTGGKVEEVKFGHKDANDNIKPDSDKGYTLTADGGKIDKVDGQNVDYTKQDIVCAHGKYGKTEETKGTPATCKAAGTYDYFKCDNCHRYISLQDGVYQDVTNDLGNGVEESKLTMEAGPTHHVFLAKDVVAKVEPTCTDTGKEAYAECSVCHQAYAKAIDAGEGNYTFEEVENEDALTIEALGHDNEDIPAIDATCTQNGWTAGVKCKRCNAILKSPVLVDMAPHTYGNEIAEAKATCKDFGTKAHYQCSACKNLFVKDGDVYTQVTEDQLVIPATGHNYNDGIITKEATCTADGIKTFTCETCNDTYTEVIPAIGHDWDWTLQVTKEPTCIAGGEGEITCKRCDEKEIVIIDNNPSAHKYKNDGICQLCGQKDPGYVVVTQSGSNVTTSKDTSKNNKKNEKIVKIINSRNKTKVKIKKKKIIIKFSRRGGCKYRIKIYNKKNKEISLKVKQDYMKGNGKKKFKKFYQIKKKGDYRIEIYELKGMKEKNFKDVKCIYLNYKTIK